MSDDSFGKAGIESPRETAPAPVAKGNSKTVYAIAVLFPALLLGGLGLSGLFRKPSDLPVLNEVPTFTFRESRGRDVGLADLRGKVWIAAFIFTTCANTCPTMTAQMQKIEAALAASPSDVRLVSFTVDPDRDTESVLQTYAQRAGAGERWLFLRGPRDAVYTLAHKGFWLGGVAPGLAPAPPDPTTPPGAEPIPHSRYFALVDKASRIRAYFDGTDPDSLKPLVAAARALLAESAP